MGRLKAIDLSQLVHAEFCLIGFEPWEVETWKADSFTNLLGQKLQLWRKNCTSHKWQQHPASVKNLVCISGFILKCSSEWCKAQNSVTNTEEKMRWNLNSAHPPTTFLYWSYCPKINQPNLISFPYIWGSVGASMHGWEIFILQYDHFQAENTANQRNQRKVECDAKVQLN